LAAPAAAAPAEPTSLELVLHVTDRADAQREVLRLLSANDILPLRLELQEPTIERLFLEAVQ
jgi:hypothetical protein